MKLRFLNAIAAGALLAASVALAGGSALAQDKTLSVGTWYWNQPVLGDWWKMVGEKFEADNPGVKLDVRNLPVNDYMTQVVIEVASGNPADAGEMRQIAARSMSLYSSISRITRT